jgi:histidine triad (HIT) family protein
VSPCLLCTLIEGLLPSHKVYEDEYCVALLDIHPAASGHTLLIPKAHKARVEDLTSEQSEALFKTLHELLTPIREAVGADATTIGINNGPGSGQEIQHVHIHIIPRLRGDHGGIIQSLGPGGRTDLQEISEKIRLRIGQQ